MVHIPDLYQPKNNGMFPGTLNNGAQADVVPGSVNNEYVFKKISVVTFDGPEGVDPVRVLPNYSRADAIKRHWDNTASVINQRRRDQGKAPLHLLEEEICLVGHVEHIQDRANGSDIEIKVGDKEAIITVKPLYGKVITVEDGLIVEKSKRGADTVFLTPGGSDEIFPILKAADEEFVCSTIFAWVLVHPPKTILS